MSWFPLKCIGNSLRGGSNQTRFGPVALQDCSIFIFLIQNLKFCYMHPNIFTVIYTQSKEPKFLNTLLAFLGEKKSQEILVQINIRGTNFFSLTC